MILKMVLASAIILAISIGWVVVQQLARAYALRHPEFGPPREEGAGCGGSCLCRDGGSCQRTQKNS